MGLGRPQWLRLSILFPNQRPQKQKKVPSLPSLDKKTSHMQVADCLTASPPTYSLSHVNSSDNPLSPWGGSRGSDRRRPTPLEGRLCLDAPTPISKDVTNAARGARRMAPMCRVASRSQPPLAALCLAGISWAWHFEKYSDDNMTDCCFTATPQKKKSQITAQVKVAAVL